MKTFILAAAILGTAMPAFADDLVIKDRDTGPSPRVSVDRDRDCSSRTVQREDGAGDSKTVTKTNCY